MTHFWCCRVCTAFFILVQAEHANEEVTICSRNPLVPYHLHRKIFTHLYIFVSGRTVCRRRLVASRESCVFWVATVGRALHSADGVKVLPRTVEVCGLWVDLSIHVHRHLCLFGDCLWLVAQALPPRTACVLGPWRCPGQVGRLRDAKNTIHLRLHGEHLMRVRRYQPALQCKSLQVCVLIYCGVGLRVASIVASIIAFGLRQRHSLLVGRRDGGTAYHIEFFIFPFSIVLPCEHYASGHTRLYSLVSWLQFSNAPVSPFA